MRRLFPLLALAGVAFLSPQAGYAIPFTYHAIMNAANENPSNPSAGLGFALVTIDVDANTLQIDASFSGLTGTTTAAHIHCCVAPPGNVGVATETPSFTGFPLGVNAGVFSNTFDTSLASTWNGAFITANGGNPAGAEAAFAAGLANGQAYFNIHSTFRTGGEIRGFLSPVPEPGTLVLLGAGLFALAGYRRRR